MYMKKITLISLILASIILLPQTVLAIGQVTEPINITNALRGKQIHEEITALNGQDTPVVVDFSASGQIKDWVKFYRPNDLQNAIASTSIDAKSYYKVTAVISVPDNAPNGEYKGAISVMQKPSNAAKKDESFSTLQQKIDRQVTITVSDTEVIKLDVSVIPKSYDIQPNEALDVRIIYDNQSNISLRPSISFKIVGEDEKSVYDVIYPYPESAPDVNSKAMYEIPALKIPTAGIANGNYVALLKFIRADKTVTEKQFGFSIGTQTVALNSKISSYLVKNLSLLMWAAAVILLAIIGFLARKNIQIRQSKKNA